MLDDLVIVDGHEELSLGALAEGRNYLLSARAIQALEEEEGFANPNGTCMLGLADWLAARVAVIVATVVTIRGHTPIQVSSAMRPSKERISRRSCRSTFIAAGRPRRPRST